MKLRLKIDIVGLEGLGLNFYKIPYFLEFSKWRFFETINSKSRFYNFRVLLYLSTGI